MLDYSEFLLAQERDRIVYRLAPMGIDERGKETARTVRKCSYTPLHRSWPSMRASPLVYEHASSQRASFA